MKAATTEAAGRAGKFQMSTWQESSVSVSMGATRSVPMRLAAAAVGDGDDVPVGIHCRHDEPGGRSERKP